MTTKAPKAKPAKPKAAAKREDVTLEPVRSPRVFAGPCPRSPHHEQTRVYKTLGRLRYCVCDDCGHTWKLDGPAATLPEVPEAELDESDADGNA